MTTHYVAGFLFDEEAANVALIRKSKPRWQAGLLNGIGGHVEANESPERAMAREFYEETGVLIPISDWKKVAVLNVGYGSAVVHAFAAFSPKVFQVTTAEAKGERTEIHAVADVHNRVDLVQHTRTL